jgi:hypothetical protein
VILHCVPRAGAGVIADPRGIVAERRDQVLRAAQVRWRVSRHRHAGGPQLYTPDGPIRRELNGLPVSVAATGRGNSRCCRARDGVRVHHVCHHRRAARPFLRHTRDLGVNRVKQP